MTNQYPEHEKMKEVTEHSQRIGEMIDNREIVICKVDDSGDLYAAGSVVQQLALLFDIDLNKIEDEKGEMLASLRGDAK